MWPIDKVSKTLREILENNLDSWNPSSREGLQSYSNMLTNMGGASKATCEELPTYIKNGVTILATTLHNALQSIAEQYSKLKTTNPLGLEGLSNALSSDSSFSTVTNRATNVNAIEVDHPLPSQERSQDRSQTSPNQALNLDEDDEESLQLLLTLPRKAVEMISGMKILNLQASALYYDIPLDRVKSELQLRILLVDKVIGEHSKRYKHLEFTAVPKGRWYCPISLVLMQKPRAMLARKEEEGVDQCYFVDESVFKKWIDIECSKDPLNYKANDPSTPALATGGSTQALQQEIDQFFATQVIDTSKSAEKQSQEDENVSESSTSSSHSPF